MGQIQVLNINDAIHQLLNPKGYNYLVGFDAAKKANLNTSTMLAQFQERKSIISWNDWVKLLAQKRDGTSAIGERILRLDDRSAANNGRSWGMTFGSPKGYHGRPIAETKPLDEMFFYYDIKGNYPRDWLGNSAPGGGGLAGRTFTNSDNEAEYAGYLYSAGAVTFDRQSKNTTTLKPGAYFSVVRSFQNYSSSTSYYHYTRLYINNSGVGVPSAVWELGYPYGYYNNNLGDNIPSLATCMFFVDTPVTYAWTNADVGSNPVANQSYGWEIYRITPEGYWE
jgi:hypothetical protein